MVEAPRPEAPFAPFKLVLFDGEGKESAFTALVSADLRQIVFLAQGIGAGFYGTPEVRFGTLILALAYGDTDWSRWFSNEAVKNKLDFDQLWSGTQRKKSVQELREEFRKAPESAPNPLTSFSALTVFRTAGEIRRRTAGDETETFLDVRHILSAFIFGAHQIGHELDYKKLRWDVSRWVQPFLAEIGRRHPKEIDGWRKLAAGIFPESSLESSANPPIASSHLESDRWTVDDTLGYHGYALAVAHFIRNPNTTFPMVIGIQAPWGGGKTSLMRMIQKQIDPTYPAIVKRERKKSEAPAPEPTLGNRGWFRSSLKKIVHFFAPSPKAISLGAVRERKDDPSPFPALAQNQFLTIWFNPWHYESTNQIWAGLADALVQQYAARLSPVKKEEFFFRLNLRRADPDKLRRALQSRTIRFFWKTLRWAAILPVLTFLISVYDNLARHQTWVGPALWPTIVTLVLAPLVSYWKAWFDKDRKPFDLELTEFTRLPDYCTELGFIHQVREDVERIAQGIPDHQGIVVFIDDLDRCSPTKVAQVVEGLNLFLAGLDSRFCFILGMDAEMVAAALQSAHAELCSYLPPDALIPVGWRFMEKFIQLPFVIPPAEPMELQRFAAAHLLAPPAVAPSGLRPENHASSAASPTDTPGAPTEAVQPRQQEDQDRAARVERDFLDRIWRYREDGPEVRSAIAYAADHFMHNPREIKRFINAFRFHSFLRMARQSSERRVPSLEQLQRWLVLLLKWPDLVRWLHRGAHHSEPLLDAATGTEELTRLQHLEATAMKVSNRSEWTESLAKTFSLDPAKTPWLLDKALFAFFQQEVELNTEDRLSAATRKGFW